MNSKEVRQILEKHVPTASVDYTFSLWESYRFNFKLRKARLSKVGDFTYRPGQTQQITINQDIHPYLFLTTYIHEVAHLKVHLQFGHRVSAHGKEWKAVFQELMVPVLDPIIFPLPLLKGLRKHMANPKASSFSDSELTALFRAYDDKSNKAVLVSELPQGSIFSFHGRWFKKGVSKRTRVLCQELKTKRQYLVPGDAEVGSAQLALL
ncbi:MAG: SprT-like domain-containing protein [Cyclobacteriaceae bacterium]